MSSVEDFDYTNHSQTYQRIVDLLQVRSEQRHGPRKLYNDILPENNRSLMVEKIHQASKNVNNPLRDKPLKNISLENNNAITPNNIRCSNKHKSIVCSTPFSIYLKPNFGISLSPVKKNTVQHNTGTNESVLVDEILNEKKTENNKGNVPPVNLSVTQVSKEVKRTENFSEKQNDNNKCVNRVMPKVSKTKPRISKLANLNDGGSHPFDANELADSSDRYKNAETMPKSDVDLTDQVRSTSKLTRSRLRGITPISTEELEPKQFRSRNMSHRSSSRTDRSRSRGSRPISTKDSVTRNENSMLLKTTDLQVPCSPLTSKRSNCDMTPAAIPESNKNQIEVINIETVKARSSEINLANTFSSVSHKPFNSQYVDQISKTIEYQDYNNKSTHQEMAPVSKTKSQLGRISQQANMEERNSYLDAHDLTNSADSHRIAETKSKSRTSEATQSKSRGFTPNHLLQRERSACDEINPVIILENQNNEREIIPIGAVETQHQSSLTNREQQSPLTNQNSLMGDTFSSASHKLDNSQVPDQIKRLSKKKGKKTLKESYLQYLDLEQSAKRKSATSGTKRKLYSAEQTSQILQENFHTEEIRNTASFKKITKPVHDSDGFKIPNISLLGTMNSKFDRPDNPIELSLSSASELGVIAENIRILNNTGAVSSPNKRNQFEGQTKSRSPQKSLVKAKNTKRKVKQTNLSENQQTLDQNTTGVRRSSRVRHEPMTFWKVHKEPLTNNNLNFYKKMFLNKSPKSKPIKKRQVNAKRATAEKAVDLGETVDKRCDIEMPNSTSTEVICVTKSTEVLQSQNGRQKSPTVEPRSIQCQILPDWEIQTTTDSENLTNPCKELVKKFVVSHNAVQQNAGISTKGVLNFICVDKLVFKKFTGMPGVEYAVVPNTNETLGMIKLQPGSKKRPSQTSRKYFVTIILYTDSCITANINNETIQMTLNENDFIQLSPHSKYELINDCSEVAMLMSFQIKVEQQEVLST